MSRRAQGFFRELRDDLEAGDEPYVAPRQARDELARQEYEILLQEIDRGNIPAETAAYWAAIGIDNPRETHRLRLNYEDARGTWEVRFGRARLDMGAVIAPWFWTELYDFADVYGWELVREYQEAA